MTCSADPVVPENVALISEITQSEEPTTPSILPTPTAEESLDAEDGGSYDTQTEEFLSTPTALTAEESLAMDNDGSYDTQLEETSTFPTLTAEESLDADDDRSSNTHSEESSTSLTPTDEESVDVDCGASDDESEGSPEPEPQYAARGAVTMFEGASGLKFNGGTYTNCANTVTNFVQSRGEKQVKFHSVKAASGDMRVEMMKGLKDISFNGGTYVNAMNVVRKTRKTVSRI